MGLSTRTQHHAGTDTASREAAGLGPRLPLSVSEYYALRGRKDETARLADLLETDRWIETRSDEIAAAHDIFADTLVARYVFEARATITSRVGDVLSDAMDGDAFDWALTAINRLAAHKWFGEIDGVAAITRVYARNPAPVIAAHELLLKIRIPDERTCVRLLNALPDIAAAVAADMSCDGPLSYVAEVAAESADERWRDNAALILQPLLDRAIERPHLSNMVVRRSLRCLPARYRNHALAWIRRYPTLSETHFLFVAWLRSGLPLDEIAADLDHWLVNGGNTDSRSSFVYQSWLDAAAKLDKSECADKIGKVEGHVLGWLGKHDTLEAAGFVYKSWFDAAAKLDKSECAEKFGKVEGHVLAWLGKHDTLEAAGFVYQSWLDAAAKLDKSECADKFGKVEGHVLAWLGKHDTLEAAEFVYKSWLDAGGLSDLIRSPMVRWLDANLGHVRSDFIINAWLAATRDFATVRTSALAWLKQNKTNPDAKFVLKFVVRDRDLPLETIEDVIFWCTNFPNTLDTICRIGPMFSRFASGPLEKRLTEVTLLVLEHLEANWLTDKGAREATIGTIALLAWKPRPIDNFEARLDAIHAKLLLHSSAYSPGFVANAPKFVLNPALPRHVSGMIRRKIIDPETDLSALERFADWLAAWPPDRKPLLQAAIKALEQSCPIPGLWARVGVSEG